jgi:hypothetical protein
MVGAKMLEASPFSANCIPLHPPLFSVQKPKALVSNEGYHVISHYSPYGIRRHLR